MIRINLTRVKQATSQFIKVLKYGKSDVATADQYLPAGIDSKPVKNKMALYMNTGSKGESVIVGYLMNSSLTDEGEIRIFATDSNGNEVSFIMMKNDGTIEILGNTDNLVRYSKLEEAFNDLKQQWNTFASAYVPGGPIVQGTPPTANQSTKDISQAKINELKTL